MLALPPPLRAAAHRQDALALMEGLEKLIDEHKARPRDRKAAYEAVCSWPLQNTASYAYARAALAGRVAQLKGLSAIGFIGEVETWARRSHALDPDFRDGAARRMLGTLYVLAPAAFVDHGDSETGLEMLEELVDENPQLLVNQLRLAEGYVALGDHEPAFEWLCHCLRHAVDLRKDDQRLLAKLVDQVGGHAELECSEH